MKIKSLIKQQPIKALMLFYAIIILGVVGINFIIGMGIFAARSLGYYEKGSLTLNDFEQIGVEKMDDMTMVNATDDTQLIYNKNAYNLYVKCDFSYDPGEFVLFYSKSSHGEFGTHKMLFAQRRGDYYVFEMPLSTKSFRLDTGIYPSITVKFDEIIVNKAGFFDCVRLSTGGLFWLFVIPPILFGIVSILIDIFDKVKAKLKKAV